MILSSAIRNARNSELRRYASPAFASATVCLVFAAIGKAVNEPAMKEPFTRQGFEPQASTPEQLAVFLGTEMAQNVRLVKRIEFKAE